MTRVKPTVGDEFSQELPSIPIYLTNQKFEILNYRKEFSWYYSFAEPETKTYLALFLNKKKNFIDIGANIGTHSIVASKNSNIVISVEVDKKNVSHLKKNLRDHKIVNVRVFNNFISSSTGKKKVNYWSSYNNEKITKILNTVSLDTFLDRLEVRPHLIKIDTDGHEEEILRGMSYTILKYKPNILTEVDFNNLESGQNYKKLKKIMKSYKYKKIGVLDGENILWSTNRSSKHVLKKAKIDAKKIINVNKTLDTELRINKKWSLTTGDPFSNQKEIPWSKQRINFKISVLVNPINMTLNEAGGKTLLSFNISTGVNQIVDIPYEFGEEKKIVLCIRKGNSGFSFYR